MRDLENARKRLRDGPYTCVLCQGTTVLTSAERGVSPLLAWYESKQIPPGFSAADKVVGRGAAFLYVLLEVRAVYATVISRPARDLLHRYGITVFYDTETEHIINRPGDGFCPVETALAHTADPTEAYTVIRRTLATLAAADTP